MPSPTTLDPERWLRDHGDVLYRYAVARVRDPHTAEDLVQDTFLAALEGAASYAGLASERTWLVGVLRNKIADHFRRSGRVLLRADLELRLPESSLPNEQASAWSPPEPTWITEPMEAAARADFWRILNDCLDKLGDRYRQVFVLRELQNRDAEDICRALDISPSNLWVSLHRARLQLRECLTRHGLGSPT